MAEKLHRLSRGKPKFEDDEADTVKKSKLEGNEKKRAFEVLLQAQQYFSAMWKFRKERDRNKRYYYGDQWSDLICVNGKVMTEEEYIT